MHRKFIAPYHSPLRHCLGLLVIIFNLMGPLSKNASCEFGAKTYMPDNLQNHDDKVSMKDSTADHRSPYQ